MGKKVAGPRRGGPACYVGRCICYKLLLYNMVRESQIFGRLASDKEENIKVFLTIASSAHFRAENDTENGNIYEIKGEHNNAISAGEIVSVPDQQK